MTPEAKAKELVERFRVLIPFSEYDKRHQSEHAKKCKQCAIICMDEMLNERLDGMRDEAFNERLDYLKSVKSEIEKS